MKILNVSLSWQDVKISNKGSLLMNVLVAMGIVAMMATLSIPYLRRFQPSLRLNGAARELASDLRYAQQLTITQQVPHALLFNFAGDSYGILKLTPGATTTLKSVVLPSDVSFADITGFTDNMVSFNSYGSVDESGQVILENDFNASTTIEIKPSGYIRTE